MFCSIIINARFYLIFLSFLFCISFNSVGQKNWELRSDKEGVEVYTKNMNNSPFKAVKTVCTIETSLNRLVAVLLDVNHTVDWVYGTKKCKLLKQVSPSELFYYSEISLPWPASNRDFIIRITVTQDAKTKEVRVIAENMPNYIPEYKNIIRIKQSSAIWVITPLQNGKVKIEFVLQVDPGGWLPSWLVNLFATKGPNESFRMLREQVKKPIYDNLHLPFIKD